MILCAAVRPEIGEEPSLGFALGSAGRSSSSDALPPPHFSAHFNIFITLLLFFLVSEYRPDDDGNNTCDPDHRKNNNDDCVNLFRRRRVLQTISAGRVDSQALIDHLLPHSVGESDWHSREVVFDTIWVAVPLPA